VNLFEACREAGAVVATDALTDSLECVNLVSLARDLPADVNTLSVVLTTSVARAYAAFGESASVASSWTCLGCGTEAFRELLLDAFAVVDLEASRGLGLRDDTAGFGVRSVVKKCCRAETVAVDADPDARSVFTTPTCGSNTTILSPGPYTPSVSTESPLRAHGKSAIERKHSLEHVVRASSGRCYAALFRCMLFTTTIVNFNVERAFFATRQP